MNTINVIMIASSRYSSWLNDDMRDRARAPHFQSVDDVLMLARMCVSAGEHLSNYSSLIFRHSILDKYAPSIPFILQSNYLSTCI